MKFFFYNSQLLNKLYLYFWGGDIPFLETTEENNIKKKIISEAKGIVTIIESDQEKIDQLYKPIGKKYCMQYCAGNQIQDMKKYLYPHKKKYIDKEILIQVGNSATSTNNHIDILKILEKYKKENILELEQSDPVLYKSLHLGFLSELLVPNTFCAGVFAFPFRSPMITIPARD